MNTKIISLILIAVLSLSFGCTDKQIDEYIEENIDMSQYEDEEDVMRKVPLQALNKIEGIISDYDQNNKQEVRKQSSLRIEDACNEDDNINVVFCDRKVYDNDDRWEKAVLKQFDVAIDATEGYVDFSKKNKKTLLQVQYTGAWDRRLITEPEFDADMESWEEHIDNLKAEKELFKQTQTREHCVCQTKEEIAERKATLNRYLAEENLAARESYINSWCNEQHNSTCYMLCGDYSYTDEEIIEQFGVVIYYWEEVIRRFESDDNYSAYMSEHIDIYESQREIDEHQKALELFKNGKLPEDYCDCTKDDR